MVKINSSIMDEIKKYLAKLDENGIHIKAAYLFGSYAKGNESKWSDIDIAVISPDITRDRFEERVRLMKIACEVDSRIEPAPFHPDNFVDEDPLAWVIKREGIPVS